MTDNPFIYDYMKKLEGSKFTFQCSKEADKISTKDNETMTIASKAKYRFICAGRLSFFIIKMMARQKDTSINVSIDPESVID